jgi:tetratricopeptide (TPR) repeat protein
MMCLSRYWPLAILALGLTGCSGSSTASTPGGKSAAELIESGNAALGQGEFDEALADFNSALDVQPDSARAHERRAATYLQMKKFEQALNDCRAALRIDGKLAPAYFTQGLVERDLGYAERAIEDFTKALDNGLEQVEVLTARGEVYHSVANASLRSDEAAKALEKALKDFDRAVKLAPRQAECRMQRAAVCLDLGDYDNAVADCDAALAAEPKLAGPQLAAAHVFRARGECALSEFDKAVSDCDSAVSLEGKEIEAYVLRARARLEKSSEMRTLDEVADCRQAAADCQKAIDLARAFAGDAGGMRRAKTMHALAHELRGSIYQDLRATKKALAEYERALSLEDPLLVSTLLRRAETRSAAEDYAGALNDCNLAISLDSARAEAYCGRGMVRRAKQELPEAIEDYTQAVSLDPKCAKAYAGRAIVYSTQAVAERAKGSQIEKRLRETPRLPPASSPEFNKARELAEAKQSADQKELASCLEKVRELWQKSIDDATAAIAANRHMASAYVTRGVDYYNQQSPERAFADFTAAIREDPKIARAYGNRGTLFYRLARARATIKDVQNADKFLDAAIKDFEDASSLEPANYDYDVWLCRCYKQKDVPVLASHYLDQAREKARRSRQELDEGVLDASNDFVVTPKKAAGLEPDAADSDLDPLAKAQKDLEKLLDATAEKD